MDKHWVWLTTRKGIGAGGCVRLLRRFGSAERVFEGTRHGFERDGQVERRWIDSLCDKDLSEAEAILRRCDEAGIRILRYDDPLYPERLRCISDPPALLYYRGTMPAFDGEAAIAVVGSRRCSAYGLLSAKKISTMIARCGGVVLSGGARGIDTMALRGALEATTPVVCVCGCGLDVVYPRENRYLFTEILHHGCLISEYPPGTPPLPSNFPVRNRILSGLSLGVLVIEAPEKSGALITADLALEQGRDVFAVPGNIGVKQCEGSNRLLREGAILVQDGWDLLREYEPQFSDRLIDGRTKDALASVFRLRYGRALPVYTPVSFGQSPEELQSGQLPDEGEKPPKAAGKRSKKQLPAGEATPGKKEPKLPPLSDDEQTVYSALGEQPLLPDELVAQCALPARSVATALTMLQIKGLAVKTAGNRFYKSH